MSDPYKTPDAATPDPQVDETDAYDGGGPLVTTAGLLLACTGVMQAAAAYQLLDMTVASIWWIDAWMALLLVIGLALVILGFGFTTSRTWAVLPALALSGASILLGGAFNVFALANGTFTLASCTGTGMGLLGFAVGMLAWPKAQRVQRARRKLLAGL